MELFVRALGFASEVHKNQYRRDEERTPYINHPIEVAELLVRAGYEDENLLCAALLHDVVEDCGVNYDDLMLEFNQEVADLVMEVSDDPLLRGDERKQAQINKVKDMSYMGRLIKVADKICNLKDIHYNPPVDWDVLQKEKYRDFAQAVFDCAQVKSQFLINLFNILVEKRI